MCSGQVSSSCSTSGTRRVTLLLPVILKSNESLEQMENPNTNTLYILRTLLLMVFCKRNQTKQNM